MLCFQEVEPTIGEKLCKLWLSVEGDDGILTGNRSSGIRGDHKHIGSSVHGAASMGGSGVLPPFSAAKGQPPMAPYPLHPMYFPYAHSMHHSVYPGAAGSGESRHRMGGMSPYPFFTHPPRLGYSHHPPPHPLHSMSGDPGGSYSRPGRPMWTLPPFPPPSHFHHPHQSPSHPPPPPPAGGLPYLEHNSVQEEHYPTSQLDQVASPEAESPDVPVAKPVVPRTNSRKTYSQQHQSMVKKQQQQKELSLKSGKKQDMNTKTGSRHIPFQMAQTSEAGAPTKLKLLTKSKLASSTYSFANEDGAASMVMKKREDSFFDSKKGLN